MRRTAALLAGARGGRSRAAARRAAATVAVNGTCFIEQEQIGASGAGFTPRRPGGASPSTVWQPSSVPRTWPGTSPQQLTAPQLDSGELEHTFNLTATDQNNLGNVGSVPGDRDPVRRRHPPARTARPGHRVKFSIRGMPPGKRGLPPLRPPPAGEVDRRARHADGALRDAERQAPLLPAPPARRRHLEPPVRPEEELLRARPGRPFAAGSCCSARHPPQRRRCADPHRRETTVLISTMNDIPGRRS